MKVVEIKKHGGPEVLYIGSRPIPKPKKNEVLGKFYTHGMSANLNIFKKIYYESIVRLNNKQSALYVFVLAILHFLNFLKGKDEK